MNKTVAVLIFIVALLVISLLCVFSNNRMYIRELNGRLNDKTALIEEISMKDKKAFENNGKNFSNVSITDTTGSTCNLNSIIKQKVVVFYRS
ncbi:MAG: hypothetical protein LBF59_04300 [Prevotellaceae bacterium]|jgi:predicted Holliday junction resolvase-like endonuclease|nr:hypothetical protein [Prevotellaceae bacterium]